MFTNFVPFAARVSGWMGSKADPIRSSVPLRGALTNTRAGVPQPCVSSGSAFADGSNLRLRLIVPSDDLEAAEVRKRPRRAGHAPTKTNSSCRASSRIPLCRDQTDHRVGLTAAGTRIARGRFGAAEVRGEVAGHRRRRGRRRCKRSEIACGGDRHAGHSTAAALVPVGLQRSSERNVVTRLPDVVNVPSRRRHSGRRTAGCWAGRP